MTHVAVYILYFTGWVNNFGNVHFGEDINTISSSLRPYSKVQLQSTIPLIALM